MAKFNQSAVSNIDQSTVEQNGTQYPSISFHSGDPAQKKAGGVSYQGGWFISEDSAPSDMTAYGWEKDSFVNKNGEEIMGYWKAKIEVAVIHQRKRWLVDGQAFAWKQYEDAAKLGNPRGHHQYMVVVKDAESLGQFVITLKGHAGMAFSGNRSYANTGALSCFNKTVIAAANEASKPKKWPFRAFWLPVGSAKTSKGEPMFVEVGKAPNVTKIVLPLPIGLPEKAKDVNLDDHYVGDDVLAQVERIFNEETTWRNAWDSIDSSKKDAETTAAETEEVTEEELAASGL